MSVAMWVVWNLSDQIEQWRVRNTAGERTSSWWNGDRLSNSLICSHGLESKNFTDQCSLPEYPSRGPDRLCRKYYWWLILNLHKLYITSYNFVSSKIFVNASLSSLILASLEIWKQQAFQHAGVVGGFVQGNQRWYHLTPNQVVAPKCSNDWPVKIVRKIVTRGPSADPQSRVWPTFHFCVLPGSFPKSWRAHSLDLPGHALFLCEKPRQATKY